MHVISALAGILLGFANNYLRDRITRYALTKTAKNVIIITTISSTVRLAAIAVIAVYMARLDRLNFILFFCGLIVVTYIGSKRARV